MQGKRRDEMVEGDTGGRVEDVEDLRVSQDTQVTPPPPPPPRDAKRAAIPSLQAIVGGEASKGTPADLTPLLPLPSEPPRFAAPKSGTQPASPVRESMRVPAGTSGSASVSFVPDVRSVVPMPMPVAEGSEDGLAPSGELERWLSDCDVLFRYGHLGQVEDILDKLVCAYPEDLLLLRRVVEFWLRRERKEEALKRLIELSRRLFEGRHLDAMHEALEQARLLAPENPRVIKLLELLGHRSASMPANKSA